MVRSRHEAMAMYAAMLGIAGQHLTLQPDPKPIPDLLPTEVEHAIMLKASEKRARKNAKRLRERP